MLFGIVNENNFKQKYMSGLQNQVQVQDEVKNDKGLKELQMDFSSDHDISNLTEANLHSDRMG